MRASGPIMARNEASKSRAIGGSAGAPVPLGEFAEPSFVRLPEPASLFRTRAERLRGLAEGHTLAPYLNFLAMIATVQAPLAASITPIPLPDSAPDTGRPPLDRTHFAVAEPV